jgi:hypothetical protein
MTASSRFGEFELDRSRLELPHKGDRSRLIGNSEVGKNRSSEQFMHNRWQASHDRSVT